MSEDTSWSVSRMLLRMLMSKDRSYSTESESGITKLRGIIALKGQPSTCKTEVAHRIGRWAKCPVLCIQDFLGDGAGLTCALDVAEPDFSPPNAPDQVECHHRKAFASLLAAAVRLITYGGFDCVVIKSSLSTPFELHQLLQLCCDAGSLRVIIIECTIRNKYLWKQRFETLFSHPFFMESTSWCRPRSWKDIDNDVDDEDSQPSSWDLKHLQDLFKGMNYDNDDDDFYVAWLRADPFYDLFLVMDWVNSYPLPDEFNDAIKYLLTSPKQVLPAQNPYMADYDELRRFLFDQKLKDATLKGRSQSFCEGDCVFKYWEKVPEEYGSDFCGVCQRKISTKSAYTCHFCVTTLHKTCAERFPMKQVLEFTIEDYLWYLYRQRYEQDTCKDCQEGGKEFSRECRSCLFQDRLKCHLLPTILNHKFHQHFISIQIEKNYRCKACGFMEDSRRTYGCKRCAFYCHTDCSLFPLEFTHKHGEHEHVLKLMHTRDAMEDEEDPWCDHCYEDMDPELWFYSCQVCPHYVVHLRCSNCCFLYLDDPTIRVKFVEQLQSQLDDFQTARNSIEPC